jgi:hypothetical protein
MIEPGHFFFTSFFLWSNLRSLSIGENNNNI